MKNITIAVLIIISGGRAQSPIDLPITQAKPIIDGKLDEDLWHSAHIVDDFVQRKPVDGDVPTERTEVLVIYSADALLLGFRGYEAHPNKIVASTRRRDDWAIMSDDQFAVAIDARNSSRDGYWFSTNVLGMQIDAQIFDEGERWEDKWNGDWQVAAFIDSNAWTAELKIPFSTLGFGDSDEKTIGMNFYRRLIHSNEDMHAPAKPLAYKHGTADLSIARKFQLHNIRGGRSLYVQPYVLGNRIRPESQETRLFDLGLDTRLQVTDNLVATVTVNTDFAQAETDERQINLSLFNLFFPEKRDFFLENAGAFAFGKQQEAEVFFSRRIGLEGDESGINRIVPIPLGGRLVGKAGKTELGLLAMSLGEGSLSELQKVGVIRLKQPVRERSYVGAIATIKSDQVIDLSIGLDGLLQLPAQIALTGFIAGTGTNSVSSWNRDQVGNYLRLQRLTSKTSFDVGVTNMGRNFRPALGFISRSEVHKVHGSVSVPYYFKESSLWRVIPVVGREEYYTIGTNHLESAATSFTLRTEFKSVDIIDIGYFHLTESLSAPFNIFRDYYIEPGLYNDNYYVAVISTSTNRSFSTTIFWGFGQSFGESSRRLEQSVLWKFNDTITLNPFVQVLTAHAGTEEYTTRLYRLRLSVTPSTKLNIGALIQYDNASESWASNLRMSYRQREGSEFFFTWNEILRMTEASSDLIGGSLILKYSYRWNRQL